MAEQKTTSKGQLRLVVIIVIGLAAILLAIQNREMVETRFLIFEATMPRFALLLLTAGCGFLAGFLAGTLRRRR
ncbi:MAG: LapA family protein [Candidatus Brocadiia bacterium]